MLWLTCFWVSIGCLALSLVFAVVMSRRESVKKRKFSLFKCLLAGVFVSALFMFFPIHVGTVGNTVWGNWRVFCLSLFNSMQVFMLGCEFNVVKEGIEHCPNELKAWYQLWAAMLFVIAPIFTFSFVLSMLKNIRSSLKYFFAYFRDVYVFSELNDKSLALAKDIRSKKPKSVVVFTNVFEDGKEGFNELVAEAKKIKALFFENDILVVDFSKHSVKRSIFFFAIGNNETNNLNVALKLIELYRDRSLRLAEMVQKKTKKKALKGVNNAEEKGKEKKEEIEPENTRIYVFSKKIDSELLLTAIDKGKIKVRRVNEVRSLVNRLLYERGEILFESAKEKNGMKHISAVVVGMGNHGIEMVKALAWFCQMDGYKIEINAFDKDPMAEEKFTALAPDLMSSDYNGTEVDGEAQYKITIHSGIDVESITFGNEISKLADTTYVMVALGNDDINIDTAVNLRMYYERMKIQPVIQTIIYSSRQKRALEGIKKFSGQAYNIEFIGDIESSYAENVIIDSELETDALGRHFSYGGKEATFWEYEYNYCSSVATAIHMKARIKCGITAAEKTKPEETGQKESAIGKLEHRRWNAYMRGEGYRYSGSNEETNHLGKLHQSLVNYHLLHEDDKEKDGKIGMK